MKKFILSCFVYFMIPVNIFAQGSIKLIILGNVQDAGSPHIACRKSCCKELILHPDINRKVVSLGLIDESSQTSYLFESTPDMPAQLKNLKKHTGIASKELPDGIFITHAHIGHYTGLMYLGKEAMNAQHVKVFAMPKMKTFLEQNGPWSQLVNTHNIDIQSLTNNVPVQLNASIKITPFLVPHRDEYSETVGYLIEGPHKKVLFIPDIDKWEKWDKNIIDELSKVDFALIDATFYDKEEINNRDIKEIPHPFIIESMELFSKLPIEEKHKIYFIHLNHTNPALNELSTQTQLINQNGFHVGRINDEFEL